MNTARYVLALLLVLTMPPAMLLWFIVHPFVRFWRRLGPVWSWFVLVPVFGAQVYGLALVRRTLLAVDYGTNGWLIALAVPFAGAGLFVYSRGLHGVLAGLTAVYFGVAVGPWINIYVNWP